MARAWIGPGSGASARPAISRLENGAIRFFNQLQNWAERRHARRHLYQMPDYILRDIGISRAEVQDEFEKPFWRE